MEPVVIGLVVTGLVLLFFGASLSVYGVALVGLLVGGGGGYLLGPTIGSLAGLEGLAATAVSVVVLAIVGAIAAYSILSVAVATAGGIVAALIARLIINPVFVDGAWYVELGVMAAAGIVGAWLGLVLTKTTLIVVTSFFGSVLASRSWTMETFRTVQQDLTLETIRQEIFFEAHTEPLFLGLFALGILSQFGLFKLGYVTKIVGFLPGASIVRNRGEAS